MGSYSMRPEDLLIDELDYEMRVRFITDALSHREKTAQLRKSLQKETDGSEEPPLFCKLTFDDKLEFEVCVVKMDALNKDLETAFGNADHNGFSIATSRVIHLFGRLNRLALAFSENREYLEACESVRGTLDNIVKLKFPSKPSKAKLKPVEGNINAFSVQRSPERFEQGAHAVQGHLIDDSVYNFDDANFHSSARLALNPEFVSLSEKVDRLTESFEKFLKSPFVTQSGVNAPVVSRKDNIASSLGNLVNTPLNLNANRSPENPFRVPNLELPRTQRNRVNFDPNPIPGYHDDRINLERNPVRQNPVRNEDRRFQPDMDFQNPRRNRKTIPINQWNVKFSGEGGVSLSEFLGEVELFAVSEQYSDEELFSSAIHLFTGYARKWFKANYDDLISWTELVAALREEFQSENYDFLLLSEIDSRFQGKEETFSSFLAEMRILFGKLSVPLSERYKLYVLKKNMLSSHAMAIAMLNITSVRELSIVCKRLDATKMLQDKQNPSSSSYSCFVEPAYRTPFTKRVFRNNVNEVEGSGIPFQEENEVSELRRNYYNQRPANNPVKPPVATQRPAGEMYKNLCFNCDEYGHIFRNCPLELKVFCFICGLKGATVNTCTRCRANHLNENTAL